MEASSPAAAEEVLSGTLGIEAMVVPDKAVGGRDTKAGSASMREMGKMSALSGGMPAAAAAIICGLRGLEAELARLPFLEW